jgi:plastocyanin
VVQKPATNYIYIAFFKKSAYFYACILIVELKSYTMKKIFTTLFFLFTIISASNAAWEIKRFVYVGMNDAGQNANAFSPDTIHCYVGDTVEFVWHSGINFCFGTSGNPGWPANEPFVTQGYTFDAQHTKFDVIMSLAGNFNYTSQSNGNMNGNINVTINPAGIMATPYFSLDLKSTPNPAKENLNISFNTASSAKGELKIYDIQGQAVIRQELEIVSGHNTYALPVGTLNTGLYFMEVYQDGKKLGVKKFVKE